MAGLSISRAWDETKRIVARDGRLLASVSLALVALPTAITGLIDPTGMGGTRGANWMCGLLALESLLALAGHL